MKETKLENIVLPINIESNRRKLRVIKYLLLVLSGLIVIALVVVFLLSYLGGPLTTKSDLARIQKYAGIPKIYINSEYGFEFVHSNKEKVEVVNKLDNFQNNVGQKIISVKLENSKDALTCIEGVDMRCSNISANGKNIVVQFSMSGNIVASTNLLNGKSVFFSLSCDSIDTGITGKNDYCVISDQRVESFKEALSTFRLVSNR